MNVENILKVADAIEQHSIPDLGFNMRRWRFRFRNGINDKSGHHCKTCACIGGWTEALFPGVAAHKSLGLLSLKVHALFYPDAAPRAYDATPSQAAAVLRHLAATGEVDWSIALSTDGGEQK